MLHPSGNSLIHVPFQVTFVSRVIEKPAAAVLNALLSNQGNGNLYAEAASTGDNLRPVSAAA